MRVIKLLFFCMITSFILVGCQSNRITPPPSVEQANQALGGDLVYVSTDDDSSNGIITYNFEERIQDTYATEVYNYSIQYVYNEDNKTWSKTNAGKQGDVKLINWNIEGNYRAGNDKMHVTKQSDTDFQITVELYDYDIIKSGALTESVSKYVKVFDDTVTLKENNNRILFDGISGSGRSYIVDFLSDKILIYTRNVFPGRVFVKE